MATGDDKAKVAASGRGEGIPTQVGSLDMANERDRGLLRQSIKRRWPGFDDAKKAKAVEALDAALDAARNAADYDAVNGIVKTMTVIEAQHQSDDHLADKNDRLDTGKLTEAVKMYESGRDTDAV